MLAQRIFGLAAGYEDLNDHQTLRNDTLLAGADRPRLKAARRTTIPWPARRRCAGWRTASPGATWSAWPACWSSSSSPRTTTPPEELILDFDATDDPVHGKQEGRFFHGYYDHYCFLPLYVFCGQQLLVAYLRPANIDAAQHSRAILKLLVTAASARSGRTCRSSSAATAGFCRWRLMRWCDRHGVDYILGLAKNAVLERLARRSMAHGPAGSIAATGQKQRLFEEFVYAAETWDRPRRVIAKAEHCRQGENPRFVVTNLCAGDPQACTTSSTASAARRRTASRSSSWACSPTAPVAMPSWPTSSACCCRRRRTCWWRRCGAWGWPDTELARPRSGTIRLKLLKIGGRIVRSVRRIVMHLASGVPAGGPLADGYGQRAGLEPRETRKGGALPQPVTS